MARAALVKVRIHLAQTPGGWRPKVDGVQMEPRTH